MTATLTRRYRFSASHRLHTPALTEAENTRIFGKCNNPFGHGHDYGLEVTVRGRLDAATGLLIPISYLDELVENAVLARVSRRNLNLDVPELSSLVATTENVAVVIGGMLLREWPEAFISRGLRLVRVHIQETDRNSFEYFPPVREEQTGRHSSEERVPVHA